MKKNFSTVANKLYPALGLKIREARLAANLTQKQLGAVVRLNRTSIAKIEAGEQRFTLDTLYLLASALQVSTCALLIEDQALVPLEDHEKTILSSASVPEGLKKKELDSILNAITQAGLK